MSVLKRVVLPPRLFNIRPLALRYLLAVAVVLGAAATYEGPLPDPSIAPFVLFQLAVALAATLAGTLPGLVAVLLSAAIANHAFLEPLGSWSTSGPALTATALFVLSATLTALLAGALRELLLAARWREIDQNRAQSVAHVGSWRLDEAKRELVWSDETCDIFGVPRGAPQTYDTFLSMVHPEDRARVDSAWSHAQLGHTYDIEHRIVVGGRVKWVRERAQLDHDADGAVLGGFGTVQDITDQKQAEAALRASEEQFRTMFESAGAALAQVRLDTAALMRANRRFGQLTGYTPEELAGMPYTGLVPPEERARAAEALLPGPASAPGNGIVSERQFLRKDGTLVDVELHAVAFDDRGGRPAQATLIAIDATERHAAVREVAAARLAAEEANRAKDHFLAVLSHELRTPLTPVLAGIALLEKQARSNGGLQLTHMIRRNVELEARLIDDLLDLTRITRGKIELHREVVDVFTVVERAVEVCRPDIEARRLHFGVEHGPRPCLVYADPARLQQVFWNLLKNAIKFTPKGGCVGVRGRMEGALVVVSVDDSGVGIEPAAMSGIFDAFAQERRSRAQTFGGLGLGLTISRSLTELHGGRIEASSDGAGLGSSFRVRLPTVSGPDDDSLLSPRAAHRRRTSARLKILLVEDHGDTAETMATLLRLAGHEVTTAGDVASALQEFERSTPDLVISDLGLPDRSGTDLVRDLRERHPSLRAIALSGYGQESDVDSSREAGFRAHLVKPVDPERLLATIDEVTAAAEA